MLEEGRQANGEREGMVFLEEKWNQLKLSEEEQDTIVFNEPVSEDDKVKERKSLIGKIFTDRQISKAIIGGLMGEDMVR